MEGISHEAISLAGHLRLNKLIVLFDDNSISIDGPTSLPFSDDQVQRFQASAGRPSGSTATITRRIAGAIERRAEQRPPDPDRLPTTIAFGAPTKAGTAAAHGSPLGAEEIAGAREQLGWNVRRPL